VLLFPVPLVVFVGGGRVLLDGPVPFVVFVGGGSVLLDGAVLFEGSELLVLLFEGIVLF
jgi:hypothetical protein